MTTTITGTMADRLLAERALLLSALKNIEAIPIERSDEIRAIAMKAIESMSGELAEPPTYHDVVVFAGEQRLRLFDCSYGLQLHCTRAAGWQLWNVWNGKEEMLAGEYSSDRPIRIEVRGVVICETKPAESDEA